MCKEIVQDAQHEADDTHCQKDNAPTINAKGPIPTCSIVPQVVQKLCAKMASKQCIASENTEIDQNGPLLLTTTFKERQALQDAVSPICLCFIAQLGVYSDNHSPITQ